MLLTYGGKKDRILETKGSGATSPAFGYVAHPVTNNCFQPASANSYNIISEETFFSVVQLPLLLVRLSAYLALRVGFDVLRGPSAVFSRGG